MAGGVRQRDRRRIGVLRGGGLMLSDRGAALVSGAVGARDGLGPSVHPIGQALQD